MIRAFAANFEDISQSFHRLESDLGHLEGLDSPSMSLIVIPANK